MPEKVVVEDFGEAVGVIIKGKGYAMTKKLYQTKIKPELIKMGYEIEEIGASPEEKAEIKEIADKLMKGEM